MEIQFKIIFFILILMSTSCRVRKMQYAEDVKIDSKFGFQITFDGKLPNDTISLAIDGITILDQIVFPPYKDSIDNVDTFTTRIDLDNKKLERKILGKKYEPIDFQEKRKISVEVIKNDVKSEFQVDLNKGRFIYIEDLFYYGNIEVKKRHLIARKVSIVSNSKKEIEGDYSISNEVIRLTQFKKAPAVY